MGQEQGKQQKTKRQSVFRWQRGTEKPQLTKARSGNSQVRIFADSASAPADQTMSNKRLAQQRKIRDGIATQLATLEAMLPPEALRSQRRTKQNILRSAVNHMRQLKQENANTQTKLNQAYCTLHLNDYRISVLNAKLMECALQNCISEPRIRQATPLVYTMHPETARVGSLANEQHDLPLDLSIK